MGAKEDMNSQRKKWFWMFVVVLAFTVALVEDNMAASMTASVKYRLFWIEKGPGEKGDYVTFEKAHPLLKDGKPKKLTKRIACVAGDTMSFDGKRHHCGAVTLGAVLDRTHEGKKLEPFVFNGVVPEGKVFVTGDHERSFDSRYFGFVTQNETTKLRGLW